MSADRLRPSRRRRAKPPTHRRHRALLVVRKAGPDTYFCPVCGPLGDLAAGIAHAVEHQYVVKEVPS